MSTTQTPSPAMNAVNLTFSWEVQPTDLAETRIAIRGICARLAEEFNLEVCGKNGEPTMLHWYMNLRPGPEAIAMLLQGPKQVDIPALLTRAHAIVAKGSHQFRLHAEEDMHAR